MHANKVSAGIFYTFSSAEQQLSSTAAWLRVILKSSKEFWAESVWTSTSKLLLSYQQSCFLRFPKNCTTQPELCDLSWACWSLDILCNPNISCPFPVPLQYHSLPPFHLPEGAEINIFWDYLIAYNLFFLIAFNSCALSIVLLLYIHIG